MDKLSLVFREVLVELKVESRSFFELRLATGIFRSSRDLSAVHLVSERFVENLAKNTDSVLALLRKDDNKIFKIIKDELFAEGHSGRILESELNPEAIGTPEDLLDLLFLKLEDSRHINLDQLMQLHSVIGYQIFAKLTIKAMADFKSSRAELSAEFTTPFSRGRKVEVAVSASGAGSVIVKKAGSKRDDLGFNTSPFFKKLAEKSCGKAGYSFEHGMDTVSLDPESPYVKSLELGCLNSLPFVCGPSNHTSALLSGAMLFGDLAKGSVALEEYTLAIFSFLSRGGYHSFHEVMLIAQRAGVAYVTGQYESSMPRDLLEKSGLSELFAEGSHEAFVG